jgi:hypothetical protein
MIQAVSTGGYRLDCRQIAKVDCKTFVHFMLQSIGRVILSGAKNLSERPFVSLRVTALLCTSSVVLFNQENVHQISCANVHCTQRQG